MAARPPRLLGGRGRRLHGDLARAGSAIEVTYPTGGADLPNLPYSPCPAAGCPSCRPIPSATQAYPIPN